MSVGSLIKQTLRTFAALTALAILGALWFLVVLQGCILLERLSDSAIPRAVLGPGSLTGHLQRRDDRARDLAVGRALCMGLLVLEGERLDLLDQLALDINGALDVH